MAAKKVLEIDKLETIEEVRAFAKNVLRPMNPGKEKRKLRQELNRKRLEILQKSKK